MSEALPWEWLVGAVALAAIMAFGAWHRSRPFAPGVFRASRLSRGNRLFPTQVLITPSSIVRYKPRWIGQQEESIHIDHVASVTIDTGLLFSNVLIETSGGANPIRCHGHWKADAAEMKRLIDGYQGAHHRVA